MKDRPLRFSETNQGAAEAEAAKLYEGIETEYF